MYSQSVKNFEGHNSATRHPIPFMFDSNFYGGVFGDGGLNTNRPRLVR